MKKVFLFLAVPFLFQHCTDELSEMEGGMGRNSEYSTSTSENVTGMAEIPINTYRATYFYSDKNETKVIERIDNSFKQELSKKTSSNTPNDAESAFWVGDFDFNHGDYEISVQADKKVTMLIGDKYVFDDLGDSRRIHYKEFRTLSGLQRVLIFYNMDKSQIAEMILKYYAGLNTDERSSEGMNSASVRNIFSDSQDANSITENLLPQVVLQWRRHLN